MADLAIGDHKTVQTSGNLGERKTLVTDKLQKRDEERLAELQKRKEEKEISEPVNEKTSYFEENFNRAKIDVCKRVDESDALDKSKLLDHFDDLSSSVQKLQKFLSDSTLFLPVYQIQKAQEVISKLNDDIQDKRDELIPKKKFAFKSKKKAAEKPKSSPLDNETVDGSKSGEKTLQIDLASVKFTDIAGQTLSKPEAELRSGDVALARLTNCTVKLFGSPSTIHMNNLTNCTVLCGPVSSSIFIDNCTGCTFVIPCQQLRVHTTKDCIFYLHVTSRAIIEDCTHLEFAPYNLVYNGIEQHYIESGLDLNRNNWDDVDDFYWLASDAHSPNWSLLSEDKKTQKWDI